MSKEQEEAASAEAGGLTKKQQARLDALRDRAEEARRRYGDHLVEPSSEFTKQKTEVFQVDRHQIEVSIFVVICGLDRKVKLHPTRKFDPTIFEVDPYVHHVTPESLDHLKELVGVPNRVYETMGQTGQGCCDDGFRSYSVAMHDLPVEDTIHFSGLSAEQRIAVQNLGANLLMGYADPALTERAPYKSVVDHMIDRAVRIPTFVGKDLLVCPDETVEFNGFAAVYFDNVVVVGNGRILLGNHTKLHAYQIKHV